MNTNFIKRIWIVGILLTISINSFAQSPINVTEEHKKIGQQFVNRVWILTQTGTMSIPEVVDLATGTKGQFQQIKYSEPLDKWTFRAKVNEVISNHSEYLNPVGGWSEDEEGSSIGYFLLNANSVGSLKSAHCLVLYNHRTGVAVFNTMSSQI